MSESTLQDYFVRGRNVYLLSIHCYTAIYLNKLRLRDYPTEAASFFTSRLPLSVFCDRLGETCNSHIDPEQTDRGSQQGQIHLKLFQEV